MKKILLLSTGGTIASTATEEGLAPGHDSNELLDSVPQVRDFADITTYDLIDIDSSNMQPEQWIKLAQTIGEMYSDYDGFVITHGTDTLSYTASALTYLLNNLGKPVILTGAQKPIENALGDAKRNLIDALRVATEDICGVFVVFHGKIINGPRAFKMHTKSFDAFESVNQPLVGEVLGDYIYYSEQASDMFEKPVDRQEFYVDPSLKTDVALIKLIPGTTAETVLKLSENKQGIIIESFGLGCIPFKGRDLTEAIYELKSQGKIVALTTQVIFGGVELGVYQVGEKANELKVISGKDMITEALVPKMMWALAKGNTPSEIEELILTPVQYDVL